MVERGNTMRQLFSQKKIYSYFLASLGFILIIMIWELGVLVFNIRPMLLPMPQDILLNMASNIVSLWNDAKVTDIEAIAGFILGIIIGFLFAILMVLFSSVKRIILPIYITLNAVPMIAFGPLMIIWFGLEMASKIVPIVIVTSYIVLINTYAGVTNTDNDTINLFSIFRANRFKILYSLLLPNALPSIFSGLRVAVVQSTIIAVVIEMLGDNSGLGWYIYRSTQSMQFIDV